MNSKYIFPVAIITLQLGSGAVYAIHGDARKAVYWFAAAVLNIAVTF